MSKPKQKEARYSKLGSIRQSGTSAAAGALSAPAQAPVQDDKPEPFSSHLTAATKRRLKQVSAKEGRKQFETLEQAVVEYLDANHPDIR